MSMRIGPDGGLFSEIRLFWNIFSRYLVVFGPEVEYLWIDLTV